MQTIYQKQKHHSESSRLCNVDAQETDDIAGTSTSHFNEQEDYSSLILVINSSYDMQSRCMCLYIHSVPLRQAYMQPSYRELSILIDIKLQLFCNVQTLVTDLLARNCKFHE